MFDVFAVLHWKKISKIEHFLVSAEPTLEDARTQSIGRKPMKIVGKASGKVSQAFPTIFVCFGPI